jgi:glucose dehydrogenase
MSIVFAVLLLAAMAWAVWESELRIEQKKHDKRNKK